MEYTCATKLNQQNNNYQASIKQLSSNDSIQLVLRNKFSDELIGCISFDFESFLQHGKNNFLQWITLFEDPEDDLFDGELGVNDEELPRIQVSFVIEDSTDEPQEKNGHIFVASSQNLNDQSEQSLSQHMIDSELEMPEAKSPVKQEREQSPRFDTTEENKFTFGSLQITAMQQRLNDYKIQNSVQDLMKSVSFRNDTQGRAGGESMHRIQTLENPMDTNPNEIDESLSPASISSSNGVTKEEEGGDYAVKLLKKDFAKEIALLSDKLQQANDLAKNAKELRQMLANKNSSDNAEDTSAAVVNGAGGNESQNIKNYQTEIRNLKHQNLELNEKVGSVTNALENLKKENVALKNSEASHAENLHKMKTELEKYKLNSGNNERLLETVQQQVSESQEQIKQEIQSRLKVLREKEKLSESYQNLTEEHQKLQAKYEDLVRENLSQSQPRQVEKDYYEQERESLIQENNKLKLKVAQIEGQAASQGNTIQILQESLKTLQEEKEASRTAEVVESPASASNNGSDKILINTLLSQIEDLKAHFKQSEDEKVHLKEELFKANDNYMKLTNKYIELTEAFTVNQSAGSSTGRVTNRNPTSRSRTPTKHDIAHLSTLHDHEVSDEIEHKLNEFIVANRLTPTNFNRIDKTNYVVNAKRITLKLTNGKLLVRQGTGYQPLEDYLKPGHRSQQLQGKTPPISARHLLMNQSDTSLISMNESKHHHSPDRKANVSPKPRKVENFKTEEYAQSYDWETKNNSRAHEKDEVRQSTHAHEQKKIIIEARLSRNDTLKSKDLNHSRQTLDKKNVVNNMYKPKGKTHKDLSPVLRTQPKHI